MHRLAFARKLAAISAAVALLILGTKPATPAAAAAGELCFNQPGVTACVGAEFSAYWTKNGDLAVFGYPLEGVKQQQTPEGTFTVQYFERQRLELHPEKAAPYTILIGRANDEVLSREGRDWHSFPAAPSKPAMGCRVFAQTNHSVCGAFLVYWRSHGLDLGQRGVTMDESLALWGLPLSEAMTEQNIDGDTVLTQHFERARMELHTIGGKQQILLTRLGAALVPLHMKILAVNDFHGQLSTGRKANNKLIGGAAYLAAYINQRRAQAPELLTVNIGDSVGASPPVSALFQDQPAIEFMNQAGFDLGTVGNHEFDEGIGELRRLINGGCHPTAGCWDGAKFPYISSNVVDTKTGKTIFPAYKIFNVAGARIGFVGAVLQNTPDIVVPAGVAGLEFRDEATSINAAVAELHQQGVHAIVVLLHQGGDQDTSGKLSGPVVDIVNKLDADVDVVASGHSHTSINAVINGKLVTQALSYSQAFADIDLVIDRATRDIVSKKAEIVQTFNEGITPDPAIAALVKGYEDKVAPLISQKFGVAATTITRDQNPAGESALGNLIADSQRAALQTQFAFMNPGGIRAPIEAGDVTFGTLFAVQPFANDLVKMTLTGDQIYTLLNQQWQPSASGTVETRFLQISGLSYTWNDTRAVGDKVVEVRGNDGKPLDRATSYTVTVNSFLATGGDKFTIFKSGTARSTGPVDLDALIAYVKTLPNPFTAQIEGRIVKQP